MKEAELRKLFDVFIKDGFVVIENAITQKQKENYEKSVFDKKNKVNNQTNYLDGWLSYLSNDFILDIVASETMDRFCQIIGKEYKLHLVEARLGSSEKKWHRDDNRINNNLDINYFGAMFAIDDVAFIDSGPFSAIKGSHMWDVNESELLENIKNDSAYEYYEKILKSKNPEHYVWLAKSGDAIIWNGKTIHCGMLPMSINSTRHHLLAHYSLVEKEDLSSGNVSRVKNRKNIYQKLS